MVNPGYEANATNYNAKRQQIKIAKLDAGTGAE
jgi:hypothetical protein